MTSQTRTTRKLNRRYKPLDFQKRHLPRGLYGQYVKLSENRGAKVWHDGYDSISDLRDSHEYKNAMDEARNLRKAKKAISLYTTVLWCSNCKIT